MGSGTSFDWKSTAIPVISGVQQLNQLIEKYEIKVRHHSVIV